MLYLRKMLLSKVPDLGITLCNETRNGPILGMNSSNKGSDHIKALRDRTIVVEGERLYNAVPRNIRENDGSYLGFKNCIDRRIGEVPDFPRYVGNEPEARNIDGKPSSSVKDWRKVHEFREYDDSRVPVSKKKK